MTTPGPNATLDPAFVDTVVDEVVRTVEHYAVRLDGLPVDWSSLFAAHRESLRLCESEDALEQRLNGVMARSGLSHGAFFRRENPHSVPARMAIAATLQAYATSQPPRWIFVDVREGGPAHRAQISAGEMLIAVNGEEVRPPISITFAVDAAAVLMIEGHDGVRREVTIDFPKDPARGHGQAYGTPPMVAPRAVTSSRIDSETGYLRVTFFPGHSGREFAHTLAAAFADLGPCARLIVDLRGNNGGFVGYLRLASYLTADRLPLGYSLTKWAQDRGLKRERLRRLQRIPQSRLGEIVMFFRFNQRDWSVPLKAGLRAFKPKDRSVSLWTESLGPQPFHGRIVMLINEHTFSAAETVAAFALEERLAILVGKTTAGQTNGGANFVIADRFILRLPASVWRTWRENSYEGFGVMPDVTVEQSLDGLRAGVDTQLDAAKAVVRSL